MKDMLATNEQLQAHYQAMLIAYGSEHGYEHSVATPFQVTFHLATAIAGYGMHHLDGIIQRAVVTDALQGRRLPNSARPYRIPMPLETVWTSLDGIPLYHSTSLFPVGRHTDGVFWWVKRNDAGISRLTQRKRDGTPWQPDSGSGANKEYRMPLPTITTRALTAYGVGDSDEIRRLLSMLTNIGKKHDWGFGYIVRVEIEPMESPSRHIFVREQVLLRPIPVEALHALGYQTESPAQYIAYSPPYWLPMHQTECFVEGTIVEASSPDVAPKKGMVIRSTADFLWYCEKWEFMHDPNKGELVLAHQKSQSVPPGHLCVLCGLSILEDRAVPKRDGLSSNMGNVVDFLKAPDSPWVCNACAVILAQPKKFHRNLVALIGKDEQGYLLWPTLAVDPNSPQQERPLWREVVLMCASEYLGFRCMLIFKDEAKSRIWPRAKMGSIGKETPWYFSDSDLSIQDNLIIDTIELARQMLLIESWLDQGYSKTAIRTGIFNVSAASLSDVLQIQKDLEAMRETPEFLVAWRIARSTQERALRKGNPS